MITFTEFRREFIAMIKCKKHDRVEPIDNIRRTTLAVTRTIGLKTSIGTRKNLNKE